MEWHINLCSNKPCQKFHPYFLSLNIFKGTKETWEDVLPIQSPKDWPILVRLATAVQDITQININLIEWGFVSLILNIIKIISMRTGWRGGKREMEGSSIYICCDLPIEIKISSSRWVYCNYYYCIVHRHNWGWIYFNSSSVICCWYVFAGSRIVSLTKLVLSSLSLMWTQVRPKNIPHLQK